MDEADKVLADNVRAAARQLDVALNAAGAAKLTIDASAPKAQYFVQRNGETAATDWTTSITISRVRYV